MILPGNAKKTGALNIDFACGPLVGLILPQYLIKTATPALSHHFVSNVYIDSQKIRNQYQHFFVELRTKFSKAMLAVMRDYWAFPVFR